MKLIDVTQGSPEWLHVRLGIPTASNFLKIITPTGKQSTQANGYANQLLAEWLMGEPIDGFTGSKWTERGQEVEQSAVGFYEFNRDIKVEEVGFITDDEGTMGCSPDRLVGDDGLLEIKCLKADNHMDQLFEQAIDPKHYPQVQGQLLITGRAWCDVEYYHPILPSLILRVQRDEDYLLLMTAALNGFCRTIEEKKKKLKELGY